MSVSHMWHFSATDCCLGYGDGRLVVAGETLSVDVPPVLCERGLHASRRVVDALKYAPGPYIWAVKLSGSVRHDTDKSVGMRRTAIWGYDASEVLRYFARRVALDAVNAHWNAGTLGSFPEITIRYLHTGDKSIRYAAEYAALYAAEYAAEAAAESAARYAAEYAARYAARSAAWSAAKSAQNELLTQMVLEARPK